MMHIVRGGIGRPLAPHRGSRAATTAATGHPGSSRSPFDSKASSARHPHSYRAPCRTHRSRGGAHPVAASRLAADAPPVRSCARSEGCVPPLCQPSRRPTPGIQVRPALVRRLADTFLAPSGGWTARILPTAFERELVETLKPLRGARDRVSISRATDRLNALLRQPGDSVRGGIDEGSAPIRTSPCGVLDGTPEDDLQVLRRAMAARQREIGRRRLPAPRRPAVYVPRVMPRYQRRRTRPRRPRRGVGAARAPAGSADTEPPPSRRVPAARGAS